MCPSAGGKPAQGPRTVTELARGAGRPHLVELAADIRLPARVPLPMTALPKALPSALEPLAEDADAPASRWRRAGRP
jgi:hypothetical protein